MKKTFVFILFSFLSLSLSIPQAFAAYRGVNGENCNHAKTNTLSGKSKYRRLLAYISNTDRQKAKKIKKEQTTGQK